MFAELLGKEAGYCNGKGGSMHIADHDTGNLGANAIVGGSAGIATGAALSAKMRGTRSGGCVFLWRRRAGARACFTKSMNMASLWKLPVIYVCENNLYNEYTHYRETTAGDMTARAASFWHPGANCRRTGCESRLRHGKKLVERARARRRTGVSCSATPIALRDTTSATSTATTIARSRKRKIGKPSAIRSSCWPTG